VKHRLCLSTDRPGVIASASGVVNVVPMVAGLSISIRHMITAQSGRWSLECIRCTGRSEQLRHREAVKRGGDSHADTLRVQDTDDSEHPTEGDSSRTAELLTQPLLHLGETATTQSVIIPIFTQDAAHVLRHGR